MFLCENHLVVEKATSKIGKTYVFLRKAPVFTGSCQDGLPISPFLLSYDSKSGNYRSRSGSCNTRTFNEQPRLGLGILGKLIQL